MKLCTVRVYSYWALAMTLPLMLALTCVSVNTNVRIKIGWVKNANTIRIPKVTLLVFRVLCRNLSTIETFVYNSILLTGLEFNCMVRDFLCPRHWLLIDFSVIRNCVQKVSTGKQSKEWNYGIPLIHFNVLM